MARNTISPDLNPANNSRNNRDTNRSGGYDVGTLDKLADAFMAEIEKKITDKMSGNLQLKTAVVSRVYPNRTVDVYIPPNNDTILKGIQNQCCFELSEGDTVELILKNGSFSNCWVLARHGGMPVNQSET